MKALFAVCFLALAACATPYQEDGFTGGVEAAPLGGDLWRIDAHLNAYSGESRAQDFVLMRAAEIAKAQGAVGFVIVENRDTGRSSASYTAPQPTSPGSPYMTGGRITTQVKPGALVTVRLVREPVDGYFNADEIIASIGPRLKR